MSGAIASAELHYTDFDDADAFDALVREHGLEYSGAHPASAPGATSHLWQAADGLKLWTAKDPTESRLEEVSTADGSEMEDRQGYASYVFIEGPTGAAEMLFRDVIETAVYVKGEFQPLETCCGDVVVTLEDVENCDD